MPARGGGRGRGRGNTINTPSDRVDHCGTCSQACGDDTLGCDRCDRWFHPSSLCMGLPDKLVAGIKEYGGTNFAYYPDGTHLVAVEPNPHFKPYYNNNRQKFPNIQSEEVIICSVEEMDMVESSSVDVVVSTFVFCSVTNTKKVLQQILRVLVPGGRFYFYEHIAEFDTKRHATRRKAQELLSRLGIWPFIFAGCMVNRDMLEDIQQAGFSKVQAQRFCSPFEQLLFQMVKPSLMGMAQKGEAFTVKSYTCPGAH